MNRPKILFLTLDVPRDGGSGGQIVSWRLLEAYRTFAEVDVLAVSPAGVSCNDELRELASRVELIPLPDFYYANARLRTLANFARAQVGGPPFRIRKFALSAVVETLRRWKADGSYHAVHCDHLSTAQYRGLFPELPALLVEHNVESEIFARLANDDGNRMKAWLLRREGRKTADYEKRIVDTFDHVLTLSDRDRTLLTNLRPDLADRISVWPIPVAANEHVICRDAVGPRILALGSLRSVGRVRGLRWFLTEVWPLVRNELPNARLEVVGADPPVDIAAQDGRNGVKVHGYLEDLGATLEKIDVCAIPLFVGGGVRIKVLEMLALGIPCLGTPIALQGLETLRGCRTIERPEEWLQALRPETITLLRREAFDFQPQFARDRTPARSSSALERTVQSLRGARPLLHPGSSVRNVGVMRQS